MWNNNTTHGSTGMGSGANSIANLEATNQSRFGRDTPDTCFTANGVDCADALIGTLRTTGQVVGPAGALTAGGGGVTDGDLVLTQRMDQLNSAGGDSGWPPVGPVSGDYGFAIMGIRREGGMPGQPTTPLSEIQRCWVGLIVNSTCVAAGAGTTADSGINGAFDFLGPEARYSTVNATTGAVTNRTTARDGTALDMTTRADGGVGFYNVQMVPVDAAGNVGSLLFRRFVRDIVAPVTTAVVYPVMVAPAGQVTISTTSQDDLALWKADAYLAFPISMLSFQQSESVIMAFPTSSTYNSGFPYPTSFSPSPTFSFTSGLFVGALDFVPEPATNFVFRIFDHGRNVVEASSSGVPAVNPAPGAAPTITSAALGGSTATVCWDTDGDGCPTNVASATFGLTVTPSVQQAPFTRVEFYVGRDANNDGVVDTDAGGRQMYASLGAGSPAVNLPTFIWSRSLTGQQLAAAAGRSSSAGGPSSALVIRAVGYFSNGQAFTVSMGAMNFCTPFGPDAACLINLSPD
jgi:hypothetical protein